MRQEATRSEERKEEEPEEVRDKRRRKDEEPKPQEPVKPRTPPPPGAKVDVQDRWIVRGNTVICEHHVPRRGLFFPTNGGCPVNWRRLRSRRVTHAIVSSTGAIHEHIDDWTDEHQGGVTGNVNNAFGELWTGWTEFEVMDEEVNEDEAEDDEMKDDDVNEDQPGGEEMRTEGDEVPREGSRVKRKAEDEGDEERSSERRREGE